MDPTKRQLTSKAQIYAASTALVTLLDKPVQVIRKSRLEVFAVNLIAASSLKIALRLDMRDTGTGGGGVGGTAEFRKKSLPHEARQQAARLCISSVVLTPPIAEGRQPEP